MKRIVLLLITLFILSSCVPSERQELQEPQIITMDLTFGATTAEYITSIINVDSIDTAGNMSFYKVTLYPCNAIICMNITRNGITSRVIKDLRRIRFRSWIMFVFYNGILSDIRV